MYSFCNLGYVYEPTAMVKSLTTVVSLYITLIQCSCKQILTFQNTTTKLDQTVLQYSPCGILFQEFIVYLIILQNYAPIITSNCDTFAQFADLLDLYDQFNKSICNSDNDATTMDMAWPCAQATGVQCYLLMYLYSYILVCFHWFDYWLIFSFSKFK